MHAVLRKKLQSCAQNCIQWSHRNVSTQRFPYYARFVPTECLILFLVHDCCCQDHAPTSWTSIIWRSSIQATILGQVDLITGDANLSDNKGNKHAGIVIEVLEDVISTEWYHLQYFMVHAVCCSMQDVANEETDLDCALCVSLFYNNQQLTASDDQRPKPIVENGPYWEDYIHNELERPKYLTNFDWCRSYTDKNWHSPLMVRIHVHAKRRNKGKGSHHEQEEEHRYYGPYSRQSSSSYSYADSQHQESLWNTTKMGMSCNYSSPCSCVCSRKKPISDPVRFLIQQVQVPISRQRLLHCAQFFNVRGHLTRHSFVSEFVFSNSDFRFLACVHAQSMTLYVSLAVFIFQILFYWKKHAAVQFFFVSVCFLFFIFWETL